MFWSNLKYVLMVVFVLILVVGIMNSPSEQQSSSPAVTQQPSGSKFNFN